MMQHVVFVYGFNLKFAKGLVADLTAEQMCQQPHGVVNHPAWSLGHLAASKVGLLRILGHDASLPVGWGEALGQAPCQERAASRVVIRRGSLRRTS